MLQLCFLQQLSNESAGNRCRAGSQCGRVQARLRQLMLPAAGGVEKGASACPDCQPSSCSAERSFEHTLSRQSKALRGNQVQTVGGQHAVMGVSLSAAPGPLHRRDERPTITAGASRDHSGVALDIVILVVARDTTAGLVVVVTVGHRQAVNTLVLFWVSGRVRHGGLAGAS